MGVSVGSRCLNSPFYAGLANIRGALKPRAFRTLSTEIGLMDCPLTFAWTIALIFVCAWGPTHYVRSQRKSLAYQSKYDSRKNYYCTIVRERRHLLLQIVVLGNQQGTKLITSTHTDCDLNHTYAYM